MKIFQINDTEWWAAQTMDQAIELYKKENFGPDSPLREFDIHELTDSELDRKLPAFDEDERPIPGEFTSGREMLAEMIAPGFVASSEY